MIGDELDESAIQKRRTIIIIDFTNLIKRCIVLAMNIHWSLQLNLL